MEELVNLRQYAEQNGISWFICKQWINAGLKTIGKRPYRTKKSWIDDFMENFEGNKPQRTVSRQHVRQKVKCNSKIDLDQFL